MLNQRENFLSQNSFFISFQISILFLTGIPIFSELINNFLHQTVWIVPKEYELKMYLAFFLLCMTITKVCALNSRLFSSSFQRSRLFFLLFCPSSALLYDILDANFYAYLSIFLSSAIGAGVFYFDSKWPSSMKENSFFNRYYYKLLIFSVGISIFIITLNCKDADFILFSQWIFISCALIFLTLRYIHFNKNYLLWFLPPFLFCVTFSIAGGTFDGGCNLNLHYFFFLGPVIEVLYGHIHPLMLDIQYGVGLTSFLATYFKIKGSIVSINGLLELARFLTFIQYLLAYFIGVSIFRSHKIAFLALIAILIFNFFSYGDLYYCGPSRGFIRFGFIYFILLAYSLEDKFFSKRTWNFVTATLGSLAVIWSFESAVYTIPALFFAEYISKNLKNFLPIFIGVFIVMVFAYISPLILKGNWPLFSRYYEYAMLYANGFYQVPFPRLISFWWLFPLLYGFFLIQILSGNITNKLIAALTVNGIFIFTYYAGRALTGNLFTIAIPFILLSIYLVVNLKEITLITKQLLLTLVLMVFISVAPNSSLTIKNIWIGNVPGILNYLASFYHRPYAKTPQVIMAEKICIKYQPFTKYIENNSILLISHVEDISHFYGCKHIHNALALDPYLEIAINPKAVKRFMANIKVSALNNKYLIFDSELKQDFIAMTILEQFSGKKIGEIQLEDNATYEIFQKNDSTV